MSLDRIAEKYSPTGSVVARMLPRAVRNTSLDEWSLLLRETLQNSVDARVSTSRQVHFEVSLDEATAEQRRSLREDVFGEIIPTQLGLLTEALRQPDLPLLIIADWGTCGLGGPTKADVVTDDRTDFQDFFLNVGREETKTYKGGTFGLGRGVLFDISSAATIVVFTRTKAADRPVVRLMGMSLSETYNHAGHRYTGRHWWGIDSRGQPDPVTGVHAEQLARQLGLDVIPEDSTGTAILVVAPRMPRNGHENEAATLEEPLDAMIHAVAIYGWPLMLGRHGRPAVRFRFGHGGEYWEPRAPDEPDSPVRHFVEAYRIAEAGVPPDLPTSWCYRDLQFRAGRAEPKVLGNLVFRHFPPVIGGSPEEDPDIPAEAVALMREPRMVVRYLPVAKHPAGSSTVGVFIADSDYDTVFAESEPVAHDDWIPAKIASAKNQRNPVKQALDKILQAVKDSWGKSDFPKGGGAGPDGLAPVIGDLLAGLVADTQGFGGPPRPGEPVPKPPTRPKTTRAIVKPPHLRPGKGEAVVAVFPVQVVRKNAGTSVTLRAEAKVVLDRGLEGDDDRPEGAPTPAVVGWETADGRAIDDQARLAVDASVSDLQVLVDQPNDTVVTVEVTASEAS